MIFMRSLIVLAALLLVSCNGKTSPTAPDGFVPFVTVHKEQSTGIKARRAEVISLASQWERTWEEIVANRSPKPPIPAVDFEQSILILAALGETGDACKSVAIEKVERAGGELQISVKETRPAANCVCPPVTVQPVHVVSVPRAATGAAFAFRPVTEGNCN